jgi:hypothetical protein
MKIRPIACALIVAMTPVPGISGVAFAQTSTDEAMTAMARARFKEGVGFYDKKQYEAARAAFIQAYALKKHPAVLLNLAWSCLKSGHSLEAERYFAQFLRDAPNANAAEKAEAEKGLSESRVLLGRIQIDALPGTEVTVDRDSLGRTPLDPITVEPGTHFVKLRTADGQETMQTLFAPAGQVTPVRFNPPPKASANTSALPASVLPTKPASVVAAESTTPNPAATMRVEPDTEDKPGVFSPPRNMAPVYIGLGLSLASFGVAGGMLYAKSSAQSKADDVAEEIRSQPGSRPGICNSTNPAEVARFGNACKALSDNNDAVNTDALIGNIALGVGGLALASTLVYYFVAPKKQPKKAATGVAPSKPLVTPLVGQRIGGLMVQGEF